MSEINKLGLNNLKTFSRDHIIRSIIKLHNFSLKRQHEVFEQSKAPDFWTIEEYEVKPDRFYLVESLNVIDYDDYDKKTFYPKTELRYHFRSQERASFGNKHDYFYKGYKSTLSFTYDDISDTDYGIERMEKEFNDYIIERENEREKRKNESTTK